MIKDLKLSEIFNSPLKQNLIKNQFNGFDFISFFGSFYITTDQYLPICSNHFLTSTDLFGFYQKKKYQYLFSSVFKEKIVSKQDEIEIIQNCFVLGSTNNYYHDLIDCFSRIFSYDKNFLPHRSIDKIAVNDTNTVSILKEILNTLDIKIPVITLSNNKIYKFENSNITANRRIKRTINLYRKFFLPKTIHAKNKIFISRKDSLTRTIINEKEIVNLLKTFSFESDTLRGKTLEQQIELFSSSKLIVSMHGSALTNLLFTPSGSTVIEITGDFKNLNNDWISEKNSEQFAKYTRSMFNLIALECNINHYFYFSKINKVSDQHFNFDFEKITHSNLLVNISTLKKFLISKKLIY